MLAKGKQFQRLLLICLSLVVRNLLEEWFVLFFWYFIASNFRFTCKKSLKIPNEYSETVGRWTDNAMVNRERTKLQTVVDKASLVAQRLD